MAGVDELYSKTLPVFLKFADREQRASRLLVTLELHNVVSPSQRKELVVRLTNDADAFFLYILNLSEEDFQSLKAQLDLHVDFAGFPQMVIQYLNMCQQEEAKEIPKFKLDLVANGSGAMCTANLCVIENNEFRRLCHLQLKFMPGTDADIKKYLALCLTVCKDHNLTLRQRLEATEDDLSRRLVRTEESLCEKTKELDKIKSEWTNQISALNLQHKQDMNEEREKTLRIQTESQGKFEREKRQLELTARQQISLLEKKVEELEAKYRELSDIRHKNESTIRDNATKIDILERENSRLRQDSSASHSDFSDLNSKFHEQEKLVQQLKTQIAVLEQQSRDNQETISANKQHLSSSEAHRRQLEEELERRKTKLVKAAKSCESLTGEVNKANDIISKLQQRTVELDDKVKRRSTVIENQQEIINTKENELKEIRNQLEKETSNTHKKEEENLKLKEDLQTAMEKLQENKKLLQSNENMISWLHKQLTEKQHYQPQATLGTQYQPQSTLGTQAGPFELNSTMNSTHKTLSSSMGSASNIPYRPSHAYHPPRTQVQFQGHPPTKDTAEGGARGERPPPTPSLHPSSSDSILDPKYLQPSEPSHPPPPTTSIHFTHPTRQVSSPPAPNSNGLHPGTSASQRLSKEAIVYGRGTAKGPPLVSAYFPGQTKP